MRARTIPRLVGVRDRTALFQDHLWRYGTIQRIIRGLRFYKIKGVLQQPPNFLDSLGGYNGLNLSFMVDKGETTGCYLSIGSQAPYPINKNQKHQFNPLLDKLSVYERTILESGKGILDLEKLQGRDRILKACLRPVGGSAEVSYHLPSSTLFKANGGHLLTSAFQLSTLDGSVEKGSLSRILDALAMSERVHGSYLLVLSPYDEQWIVTTYLVLRKLLDGKPDEEDILGFERDQISTFNLFQETFNGAGTNQSCDPSLIQNAILRTHNNQSTVLKDSQSLWDLIDFPLVPRKQDMEFAMPDTDSSRGEIELGKVKSMKLRSALHPFKLREKELLRHVLIAGATGSGKTNLAFLMVKQFLDKRKPFLVFDWKRNYRDLLTNPEIKDKDVLVFTVGRDVCPFHFNPLIPPEGTSPTVWLKKLIEIICHAYYLGEGVAYLLTKAIDHVYKEKVVYDGSGKWPTLRDVLGYLENYDAKGREKGWLASTLRAVGTLCFGEIDQVLNSKNYPIHKLLKKNVILELDALTNSDKIFLIESLLLWIHHYRLAQGKRETWKHTTIIEEAHHILLKSKKRGIQGEAITDVILREIRELGESLIILDQHPFLLSKTVLGNTYTTVCFNLKEKSDMNAVSKSLALTPKEKRVLTKLETGEAITKLQGRFTDPFLIQVPLVKVRKGEIQDEQLKDRMTRFYEKLERVRVPKPKPKRIRKILPEANRPEAYGERKRGVEERSERTVSEEDGVGLSEVGVRLLRDVVENPISKVTERYERLGVNRYQGDKAKRELMDKRLIKSVRLPRLDGTGYWGKTFKLTDKGRKVARNNGMGVPLNKSWRQGGYQHQYMAKLVKEQLEGEGYRVDEEYELGGGKTTDLVVDGRIALEVETGKSNPVENVKKNLEAGFEKVLVIYKSGLLKQKVERKLMDNGLEREKVKVVGVKEILKGKVSDFISSSISSTKP